MNPPKVVFDTNIFISAILFGGKPEECLWLARDGKIRLITSKAILLELAEKLHHKFGMSSEGIEKTIGGISKFAEIVGPSEALSVIKKDEDDNRVLEAAKESQADFIISGDRRHILSLKKFEESKIVSAAEFLKLIGEEDKN